jgi:FtsZ-binding cell division protein ZapB
MSRDMRLNYDLFDCISEIERVDQQIYRLQMYREELVDKKNRLKQEIQQEEFDNFDGSSAYLKQQMAMNLLNEKLSEK